TAMICLWSEERGLFVPAAVRSPYAAELKDVLWERDTGIVGWAVQSREPCLVTDARSDPRLEQELGLSQFLRSLIFIPLAYEDEVLGIFVIGDRQPGVYREHNLHILTIVGGLATVALDNTRLHHRLKKAAGYDPLTGLPNRYQFWRHLQSELHRTRSQDQPLAVILIEIDQLSVLNGRYGFAVGDYALVQFARALEDRVGARGTVARYGGDGFALLLPEFGEIRATEIAERLQRAVEQISFGVEGREERVRLSVRIGLAVSPLDGATADELLRQAESYLYASGEPVIAGASPAGGSRGRA
ncbi:MAG: GGDEF domain-containing protein, partial [Candidatus Desulforudis sp.]|nr:GGDEF domain-containing protein [Desulforudis sp.]